MGLKNDDIKNLIQYIELHERVDGLFTITQSTSKLLAKQFLKGIEKVLLYTVSGTIVTIISSILLSMLHHVINFLVSINIPYLTELLQ